MKRHGWDDLLFAVIGGGWVGVFVVLDTVLRVPARGRR